MSSGVRGFRDKLLSNLSISIKNIHLRFEDDETSPGQTLACGVVLSSLDAFTVGADKAKTSAPVAELDHWRKKASFTTNTLRHAYSRQY
eukprot:8649782-Pyramimonas_sp.AAC.3